MHLTYRAGFAATLLCAGFSTEANAQVTKLVNTFSDWSIYSFDSPQARVCFAAAAPKSSEPARARRDVILFYISAWPKDGIKSEISVKIGYTFKKDSDVTVTIGGTVFKLFTADERAFVQDAGEEQNLLDALKKGSSMVVEGTSARGTVTKDTYSLSGVSQALQALASGCG
jgi:Invasion associated locus B (IalB) protein